MNNWQKTYKDGTTKSFTDLSWAESKSVINRATTDTLMSVPSILSAARKAFETCTDKKKYLATYGCVSEAEFKSVKAEDIVNALQAHQIEPNSLGRYSVKKVADGIRFIREEKVKANRDAFVAERRAQAQAKRASKPAKETKGTKKGTKASKKASK